MDPLSSATATPYSLKYNEGHLTLQQSDKKIGEIFANDFEIKDIYAKSPLNGKLINLSNTAHLIDQIKIKEERLLFAKHHPIANGALSVISSIGIPLLAVPWTLGLFMCAFGGGGAGSLLDSYVDSTQNTFNRMRPVFSGNHLEASVEEDKKELLQVINKIEGICTKEIVSGLIKNMEQGVQKYGIKGIKDKRNYMAIRKEISQISRISHDLFNRDLLISPKEHEFLRNIQS